MSKVVERRHGDLGSSPHTSSRENSNRPSNSNRSDRYERDEKFHSSLKKAATFRRSLERYREMVASPDKAQEAAITQALKVAAIEFRSWYPDQRDDSFFDAAIRLAAAGSRQPMENSLKHEQCRFEVSDDWSVPEMIGALVSRSKSTIRQQQQEICCLRLVVRELMHELLKSDTTHPVANKASDLKIVVGGRDPFASPSKPRFDGETPDIARPLVTPPTANTTLASSDSARVTPISNDFSGPPYSAHAVNRHELAKGVRISRSFSGDDQESSMLKEVQRSLDPTLRDAEQNHDTETISPSDLNATSSVWQAFHQMNSYQSTAISTISLGSNLVSSSTKKPDPSTNSISTSTDPSRATRSKLEENENHSTKEPEIFGGIDVALLKSPLREDRVEKTQVGRIVECILDAIIDMSLGQIGEDSTGSSSLMFPGLQPKEVGDTDENSVFNVERHARGETNQIKASRIAHSGSIDMGSKDKTDPSQASGAPVQRKMKDTAVSEGMSGAHCDPPARLIRMGSRNDLDGSDQQHQGPVRGSASETHQQHGELLARQDLTTSFVEGSLRGKSDSPYQNFGADDYEGSDDDNDDQGKRRMVALISGTPINRLQQANQERSFIILHSNGIDAEFVDGAESDMREIRDSLFAVSGIVGDYPQFFLVDDEGMTEFFGDFQDIEQLNDAGELKLTFSRLSTTKTYGSEDHLLGRTHEDEKNDEHVSKAMPAQVTTSIGLSLMPNSHTDSQMTVHTGGPIRSLNASDGGSDQSHSLDPSGTYFGETAPAREDFNKRENMAPLFDILEEEFALLNPSPLHGRAVSPARVSTANGDQSAKQTYSSYPSTSVFEDGSSNVYSSHEIYEDESSDLLWI